MTDYDKYLLNQARTYQCGGIVKLDPCVHLYYMALDYSSLLTEEEIDAINAGLLKHTNHDCGC